MHSLFALALITTSPGATVWISRAITQFGLGSGLGDTIVGAIQEALEILFQPIEVVVERHANDVIEVVVGTPYPNAVFAAPTNGAWPSLYTYYWDVITPLSLVLWGLAIGLVIFLETTSYLFSGYHRAKLKRRAFAGLLGLLSWWWMDALARQFMHELAVFLAPDLSQIALFETLSFAAMGVIGTVLTLSVDFVLLALIALIYFMRQIVLYLFTLMMPILIVLWIPGVGPFALVSGFTKRLAGFYFPFLFMTVPVAILFRLGQLLGENFELSMGGLGTWLTALVIPIVAVVSPFILFWQAGALFFMVERASHHSSANRARARLATARETGGETVHRSQNFVRGTRGHAAVRRDGQTVLDSGNSRAHAAGSRLNETGSQLQTVLRQDTTTDQTGGGGGGNSGSATSERTDSKTSTDSGSGSDSGTGADSDSSSNSADTGTSSERRANQFDTLRGRTDSTGGSRSGRESADERDDGAVDDEPRYIQ
jgi:hypothetical protein